MQVLDNAMTIALGGRLSGTWLLWSRTDLDDDGQAPALAQTPDWRASVRARYGSPQTPEAKHGRQHPKSSLYTIEFNVYAGHTR